MIQNSQLDQGSSVESPTLVTKRLILRRWRPQDRDEYMAICADNRVMRFVGAGTPLTQDQVSVGLDRITKGWTEQGFGPFAVVAQSDLHLVGMCGLSVPTYAPSLMPAVEIGWRLGHDDWGNGYATEAATGAVDWGFSTHDLSEILALVPYGNIRSGRVTHKLGMELTGSVSMGTTGRQTNLSIYRMTRHQWEETR